MGSPDQSKASVRKDDEKFQRHFERTVSRARWAGYAERLWDKAAPTAGGLTGLFLTASWSGMVWPNMPPSLRMAGVMLFAAAAAAAIAPLTKVKMPTRREALDRMDKINGWDRLASTYDDIPADEEIMTAESRAVWNLERERIRDKVGSFKAGAPQSSLVKRDPFAMRFALLLATGVAFTVAYGNDAVVDNITDAFEWKMEAPYTGPARIDAWVNAPDYTREPPVFIASKDNPGEQAGTAFTVPAKSVLTLMVHERNVRIETEGSVTPVDESCEVSDSGNATRCEFTLEGDSDVTIQRGNDEPLSWRFNVEADAPPQISIAPAAGEEEPNPDDPEIRLQYEIEDERGASMPGVEIKPGQSEDPEAEPLPFMNIPLNVPVR